MHRPAEFMLSFSTHTAISHSTSVHTALVFLSPTAAAGIDLAKASSPEIKVQNVTKKPHISGYPGYIYIYYIYIITEYIYIYIYDWVSCVYLHPRGPIDWTCHPRRTTEDLHPPSPSSSCSGSRRGLMRSTQHVVVSNQSRLEVAVLASLKCKSCSEVAPDYQPGRV